MQNGTVPISKPILKMIGLTALEEEKKTKNMFD